MENGDTREQRLEEEETFYYFIFYYVNYFSKKIMSTFP